MSWREAVTPVRMERVAVVAPRTLRARCAGRVADAGRWSCESPVETERRSVAALLAGSGAGRGPAGGPGARGHEVDLDRLVELGRVTCSPGRLRSRAMAADAEERDGVVALAGWAVAPPCRTCARPWRPSAGPWSAGSASGRGSADPAARGAAGCTRSLALVDTYGTVPYADVDPTVMAGIAYVAMFGMMFGDVGHGLLLVLAGAAAARRAGSRGCRRLRPGLAVRGRRRGGGHVVRLPVRRVLRPDRLGPGAVAVADRRAGHHCCSTAIGVGAVLLAGAYALGTVNRWREGGWPFALYAPSGIAGGALFLGLGAVALGWLLRRVLRLAGRWCGAGGAAGLVLVFVGLAVRRRARRRRSAAGGRRAVRYGASGSARTWSRSRGWPPSA